MVIVRISRSEAACTFLGLPPARDVGSRPVVLASLARARAQPSARLRRARWANDGSGVGRARDGVAQSVASSRRMVVEREQQVSVARGRGSKWEWRGGADMTAVVRRVARSFCIPRRRNVVSTGEGVGGLDAASQVIARAGMRGHGAGGVGAITCSVAGAENST